MQTVMIQFGYSEKATKNRKNIPIDLTLINKFKKRREISFKVLWPFQHIKTLIWLLFHFVVVPGPPKNIKALPVDKNSIMISWLRPGEPNGEILGYSLYMKTMEKGRQFTQDFSLGPHINYYTMSGLHQVRSKGSLGSIHILRKHGTGWVGSEKDIFISIST